MWEAFTAGIRWLFGWLLLRKAAQSQADIEAAKAAALSGAEKRIDFDAVMRGYDSLQKTMQTRLDDLTKELTAERAARAADVTLERAARAEDVLALKDQIDGLEADAREREKAHRSQINKVYRQLSDCVERDREGRVTVARLQEELRLANERIRYLESRLSDIDSGEYRTP